MIGVALGTILDYWVVHEHYEIKGHLDSPFVLWNQNKVEEREQLRGEAPTFYKFKSK